jgi:hypothetical protein
MIDLPTLIPALHSDPAGSGQFSIWLLGATAGLLLAVGIDWFILTRE